MYWLLQGNFPGIDSYLKHSTIIWRSRTKLDSKIRFFERESQIGDRLFIWRSKAISNGNDYGLVAKGTILSMPAVGRTFHGEFTVKPEDLEVPFVRIRLDDVRLTRVQGMVTNDMLKAKGVSNLTIQTRKVGMVFRLSATEYQCLHEIWD